RVDCDRGLAGLAVADDQLALPAANGHHRVDRLQAGLQRLLHRLPIHHAGGQTFNGRELPGGNRPPALDRLTERVDHPAEHFVTDRHRDDASRALDQVAFLDLREVAEEHGPDTFLFEVQGDSENTVRELEHLAGHRVLDTVYARDAVTNR